MEHFSTPRVSDIIFFVNVIITTSNDKSVCVPSIKNGFNINTKMKKRQNNASAYICICIYQ